MNLFTTMLARMSPKSKLIGAAILAFLIGIMFKSSSSGAGRYQACGNSAMYVLDTQNGSLWELDGSRYKRAATMPSW